MFVTDEFLVGLGFRAAEARLARMIKDGSLAGLSQRAYSDGLAMAPVAGVPDGAAQNRLGLATVQCRDLVARNGCALLALRWEAREPLGSLVPTLDADITLSPEGEDTTRMSLTAAYRPAAPGAGAADAAVQRAAAVTARSLLSGVAGALSGPI